jgi:hypothetical protein
MLRLEHGLILLDLARDTTDLLGNPLLVSLPIAAG